MNFSKIKKSLRTTKPEKGLNRLAGAQKSRHEKRDPHARRIKGQYIPTDHSRPSLFFGIIAFFIAIVASAGMVFSVLIPSLGSTKGYFLLGLLPLHFFAMISSNISSKTIPWIYDGIKIFWILAGLTIIFCILNQ